MELASTIKFDETLESMDKHEKLITVFIVRIIFLWTKLQ